MNSYTGQSPTLATCRSGGREYGFTRGPPQSWTDAQQKRDGWALIMIARMLTASIGRARTASQSSATFVSPQTLSLSTSLPFPFPITFPLPLPHHHRLYPHSRKCSPHPNSLPRQSVPPRRRRFKPSQALHPPTYPQPPTAARRRYRMKKTSLRIGAPSFHHLLASRRNQLRSPHQHRQLQARAGPRALAFLRSRRGKCKLSRMLKLPPRRLKSPRSAPSRRRRLPKTTHSEDITLTTRAPPQPRSSLTMSKPMSFTLNMPHSSLPISVATQNRLQKHALVLTGFPGRLRWTERSRLSKVQTPGLPSRNLKARTLLDQNGFSHQAQVRWIH